MQWAYNHGHVAATSGSVNDNLDGSSVELVDLGDEDCELTFSDGRFALCDAGHGINPDHPMKEVTWYGAASYCDWLSLREALERAYDHQTWACGGGDPYSAEGYRLPTDAEWEYTAQWDDEREYPWGSDPPRECEHASFGYCVGWTSVVGSCFLGIQPGLTDPIYDLSGNVDEWTNYRWTCDLGTSPDVDPPGPNTGLYRVTRGGSWKSAASNLRASFRRDDAIYESNNSGGFRVCRTTP